MYNKVIATFDIVNSNFYLSSKNFNEKMLKLQHSFIFGIFFVFI